MDLLHFNQFIVPLRGKLYRLALRITGSVHISEDVVQEVLEKVWAKRTMSHEIVHWEAWAMTLTRNLSIDKNRLKYRQVEGKWPETYDQADSEPNPEASFQSVDTFRYIRLLMEALPEKQRTVMHLRDIEEMTYEEISTIVQISLDDVKVTLHRARKTMREKLLSFNQFATKS
jgi:RNA polymerase sigma factor (sigma-70 family)